MKKVQRIINDLKKLSGLHNFIILDDKDINIIRKLEEKRNRAVLEAIRRTHVIAFTHESSFRKPVGKIVVKQKNKIIFPPVPFPEVKAKNVVSGSPGYTVDSYLRKKIKRKKEDATLIVGFDLR